MKKTIIIIGCALGVLLSTGCGRSSNQGMSTTTTPADLASASTTSVAKIRITVSDGALSNMPQLVATTSVPSLVTAEPQDKKIQLAQLDFLPKTPGHEHCGHIMTVDQVLDVLSSQRKEYRRHDFTRPVYLITRPQGDEDIDVAVGMLCELKNGKTKLIYIKDTADLVNAGTVAIWSIQVVDLPGVRIPANPPTTTSRSAFLARLGTTYPELAKSDLKYCIRWGTIKKEFKLEGLVAKTELKISNAYDISNEATVYQLSDYGSSWGKPFDKAANNVDVRRSSPEQEPLEEGDDQGFRGFDGTPTEPG
jgi:hypothetical protein